jgi:hypothetical protein
MSFVIALAVANLCILSYKRHDFWKMVIERKICVSIFSTTFM